MRAFIGIPFSDDAIDMIDDIKNQIVKHTTKSRTTLKKNYHLTLLFLGEIDLVEQRLIEQELKFIENISAFNLTINHLGSFDRNHEKIVLLGIEESEPLKKFQKRIVEKINNMGYKFPNHFKAHITLSRETVFHESFHLDSIKVEPKNVIIDKVHLYESHRVNNELTYTPIKSYSLRSKVQI